MAGRTVRQLRPVAESFDEKGRREISGVMGDLEHAERVLGYDVCDLLLRTSHRDLERLGNTIASYARNSAHVDLAEKLARLERRLAKRAR